MKKNALTVTVGVLFILYSLTNFGAALGQFGKSKAVTGGGSMVSKLGDWAGDSAGASRMRSDTSSTSMMMNLIALFILATAVLEIVSSIGLFSGKNWAFMVVVVTALCGILVEIQDTAEDGFGIGKMIFFGINALALIAAFTAREPQVEQVSE
jgi:Predicted membrane protein (DUF2127)